MKNFVYVGMGGRFSTTCGGSMAEVFENENQKPVAVSCSCGCNHIVIYQFEDDTYSVLSHTNFSEDEISHFQKGKSCTNTNVLPD
jgi:hypothetical protein